MIAEQRLSDRPGAGEPDLAEVRHEHVGLLDEAVEDPPARLGGDVERQRPLVAVERGVHPLPAAVVEADPEDAAEAAHVVWPGRPARS